MATYTGSDKRLAYLFGRTQDMQGATSEIDGAQGIIPKPKAGDNLKFLRGDGEWAEAGGNVHEMELTQEEYDALPEAEKMNGTTYYITDGENPPDEMALGNLSDVAINSPTDGQVLKYDAEHAEWVNGDELSVSVAQVLTSGTKAATVTIDGEDTDIYAPTPTDISGLESRMTAAEGNITSIQNQLVISKSVSGSAVSFTDGANAPLLFCQADIVAVQSGSGDPSPTNPRPITGYTGCTITANGNTYPISWQTEAGTIYGGYVDFRAGTLTVTWVGVDMGTLTWALSSYSHDSTYLYVSNSVPDRKISTSTARPIGTMCEIFTYTGNRGTSYITNTLPDLSYCTRISEARVYFRNDAITDATTFMNFVSGRYLVYELETPMEYYDLTKHQIWTSYTDNNISADTGDVYVDYVTAQWQAIIDVVEEIIRGTS